jgi:hypothetical protein
MSIPNIQKGLLLYCQFYEVGDEIHLENISSYIVQPTSLRQPTVRVRRAESIQIAKPPVQVELGFLALPELSIALEGRLRATIYDLGAIALTLEILLKNPTHWTKIASLMAMLQDTPVPLKSSFAKQLEALEKVIYPLIKKPNRSTIVEDYSILVIEALADSPIEITELGQHPLVLAALLGEQEPLSENAAGLISQMSYYPQDLALLSWNGALLIEPDRQATATVLALLEFANVELLLMRSYDAALETELSSFYRRLPKQPPRFTFPLVRRYSHLLYDLQRLVAEFTEFTERVDNALKVTDDVYWNRLYSKALNVLRVDVWRSGVEHKLTLLRETYSMLHDEADTERAWEHLTYAISINTYGQKNKTLNFIELYQKKK